MKDIDVLIANYQSIIRVLASQVRSLEAQISKAGCTLLPEECSALELFISDRIELDDFYNKFGREDLDALISAWSKIKKGVEL